jgi:hypothetical protein
MRSNGAVVTARALSPRRATIFVPGQSTASMGFSSTWIALARGSDKTRLTVSSRFPLLGVDMRQVAIYRDLSTTDGKEERKGDRHVARPRTLGASCPSSAPPR